MKHHLQSYKKTYVVFLCALPYFLSAQIQISGQLLDEAEAPLPFANIMLLAAIDSSLVKGDLSNEEGFYSLRTISNGTFFIKASLIGYEDQWHGPINVDNTEAQFDLEPLTLHSNTTELEGVEVVAQKPLFEYQIDRLVINVEQSITTAGATALEVLERSPGVLVNRTTGQISLSGKTGVIIMINEKASRVPTDALLQMLDGMPSENIAQIELIANPPASFDAEGNAGIINIVLRKKPDEGLNGSFSLNAGYGKNEKYGGALNLNYNKGAVYIYGNFGYRYNHTDQLFENYRSSSYNGLLRENDTQSFRDPTSETINSRLGLDFQLSPNTVLGILGSYGIVNRTTDGFNIQKSFEDGVLVDQIQIVYDQSNVWSNYVANINLTHQLAGDASLNFDLDYGYHVNENPANYQNDFFYENGTHYLMANVRADKTTPIDIWVAKIDFSTPLSANLSLETGAKGTLSNLNNNFSVENLNNQYWETDDRYTANYFLDEKIAALYTSMKWQASEKTSLKAGLRYEQTDSELGTDSQQLIVDRNYGNLFPSAFLTHKTGEQQELHLSYSRRITRPAFRQLAPYTVFFDPSTRLTGNSRLQAAIADQYKIAYHWKSLHLSADYQYIKNDITSFQPHIDSETNEQINAPINLDNRQNLSFDIAYPITITKWWRTRNNASVFWQSNTASLEGIKTENLATTFSISSSHNFKLPRGFSAQLLAYYYSPFTNGLITYDAVYELNIGFRKRLKANQGSFRLSFVNLLQGANWRGSFEQNGQVYKGYAGFVERHAKLTYSRSFGNNKLKAARKRETGSFEEQERVGGSD